MNKFFYLIFISAFVAQSSVGQVSPTPSIPAGWTRIYIKNLGSFDLPPTMEVQKGKYKEYVDEARKIKGFDAPQITAQQKGLNEMGQKGFEKYARVILETTFGSSGDFEKLNFDIINIKQADVSELNLFYKQQIQESFSGTGLKLIEWYPIKVEKVNNYSCIHVSYKRQLHDEPFVLVHIYYFQNYDRMHSMTLSYRVSETDYWKADYSTILKSFRINNIR